ncbi:hypothetical protein Plec18170_007749 [Paecilomyces lecythidis]
MAVLIVGRVLQGLGGGGLDVLSEVIVADITTLHERAVYIGLLSLPMAAGCIAGPILGAVFMGFAFYEDYPTDAVFPYRIFRSRTAQMTLLGSFIHGFVLYTLLQYLPLFFQAVYLETPLKSSISILPFCCVVFVFTGIAAFAVDFFRRYRWEIWIGWVFLAVGCGIFSLWSQSSSLAMTAGFQVIAGIGIGTIFSVPPIPMQASAAPEDQGLAMGIMVAFRLFGALIGLAVGATTFSSVFANRIDGIALPASVALLKNPSEAVGFIPYLRTVDISPALRDLIREAYKDAMQTIWYELAAFGALGFFSSLFVEELTMETEELGRQHFEHESN